MAYPLNSSTTNGHHVKKQKLFDHHHNRQQKQDHQLIRGLPDHIAHLCLSHLHPSLLYSVCRSWRRVIYTPQFPPFLSLYTLLTPITSDSHDHCTSLHFSSFDPISSKWIHLPPPTPPPQQSSLRFLRRHPSFISRHLPIQSFSVSGHLVLLAATTHNFSPALSHPLVFNPLNCSWSVGPALSPPRRWCAAGTSQNSLFVASGIGSSFSIDVAKSVEKWNFNASKLYTYDNQDLSNKKHRLINGSGSWERVKGLKNGKFSRDAIEAVGFRGKLYMVNVRGNVAKEGIVYDVKKDSWDEMPEGMVAGWIGPVAAMEEEEMYVVDEVKGEIGKYNAEKDRWEVILESLILRGAKQITAGGGRLCVVSDTVVVVVDVKAEKPRLFVVDTPTGFEVVAVHILPRVCLPEIGFSGI